VKDSEMLFIGSMGWALGAAAIAYQVGWSMPVAAYLAGLSLSFKSCRVQVLNKIGFLHIVNRFIFFFMLGIYVRLSPGFFTTMRHGYASNFAWSLVCSFVVVVGSPVFTCVASIYRGYTERTAFYSSMLVNSMGGTALIFALQCHKSGIFNLEVLAVLVVAVWLSSVFSSLFQVTIIDWCLHAHICWYPSTSHARKCNIWYVSAHINLCVAL
jgi:Kef-type K+ transport system membrane component KefB